MNAGELLVRISRIVLVFGPNRNRHMLSTFSASLPRESAIGIPKKIQTRFGSVYGKLNKVGESHDIAIFLHGLASHHDWSLFQKLATNLPFSSYRFDLPGNVRSEGTFSLSYQQDVDATADVITALEREGWNVSLLLGHSKGANCTLIYAATHGAPRAIVALAPRFDMTQRPSGRYSQVQLRELETTGCFRHRYPFAHCPEVTLTREMFAERAAIDMAAHCKVLRGSDTRALLVHGLEDTIIPLRDAHTFKAHLPALDLRLVPGGHAFHGHHDAVTSAVRAFAAEVAPQTL